MCVRRAAKIGGVDAPFDRTFQVKGTKVKGIRIDIEVKKGKAFVP